MMLWLIIALIPFTSGQEQICCDAWGIGCFTDDPPFDHLPLPGCPDEVEPNYNLYTRSNRDDAQEITRDFIPSVFNGSHNTLFIIHGWTQSRDAFYLHDLKNEALDLFDMNVVIVGWSGGAQSIDYPWSASNTRVVGAYSAEIARNLINNGGAATSRMHCAGHSLGSHCCGHFGKNLRLGRITGLDPAGPLFDDFDINCGLTPNDAMFVDIIHSGGQQSDIIDLGTMRAMGTVDFYPNNGGRQPACDLITKTDPELQLCDHAIAMWYFAYSMRPNCRFVARTSCSDWDDIPGSCEDCGGECQYMGWPSAADGRPGLFNPPTASDAPYCLN